MRIKSVTAYRIGPFFDRFRLELNERVTIITGANDVGKSSLLRAIELAMSDNVADDSFVNHDHVQESLQIWSKDESIQVEAEVQITMAADIQNSGVNTGAAAYLS
jgi:AAA15 family ATPase/GTPase